MEVFFHFLVMCITIIAVIVVVVLYRAARRSHYRVDIASGWSVWPLIGLLVAGITMTGWYVGSSGEDVLFWATCFDVVVIALSIRLIRDYVHFDRAVQDRNHELTSK
jgi:hypothetical protein